MSRCEAIRVTGSIDTLVVMSHNLRNLGIVIHLPEDSLPDDRVQLHLTSLFQRQRPWLLEETRRQSDFSNVVNQAAEVSQALFLLGKTKPACDISRVPSHGG